MFDVSRSTPKQLSVGRFEDPKTGTSLGDVRSLRCNCDGTRVSLLASKRISERSRYAGSLRVGTPAHMCWDSLHPSARSPVPHR